MNVFKSIVEDGFQNPYPAGFMRSDIPEGESGYWAIQKFEVTASDSAMYNMRLIRDGYARRVVPPGRYTRLVHEGEGTVMSDTPAEAHEHYKAFERATGRVLINGLGLGFFLQAILRKKEVEEVVVIELSEDVIKLVTPHIKDSRVEIINADALVWRPEEGDRFNFVWHDIWTDICEDNKKEMTKLRRSYGKRCDNQLCWSAEYF